MSKVQSKRSNPKIEGKAASASNSKDIVFYVLAIAAVVLSLFFVPKLAASLGVSFLADGSGLSKLFSVLLAIVLGWLCLLPAQGYKYFIDLAKGARIEWRKTVKPDRDTVMRTTAMVLLLVFLFAVLILILDWVFGSILRLLVN